MQIFCKAYKEENGYIWFVGCNDDVIKSSDYRIRPFEVESVLLEQPEILESAVVDSPHPVKGYEVKAFIVVTPGTAPDEALAHRIFSCCRSCMAPYKMPRIIGFVAELPEAISGKIRRVELRAGSGAQSERREEERRIFPGVIVLAIFRSCLSMLPEVKWSFSATLSS